MKNKKVEIKTIPDGSNESSKGSDRSLIDSVNFLHTVLEGEEFYFTGSFALKNLGLMSERREINDLDIIVINPKSLTVDLLKKFEVKSDKKYPGADNQIKISIPSNYTVDIFFKVEPQKYIPSSFFGLDVKYCFPKHIIEAKLRCNRSKDIKDLYEMDKYLFPKDWVNLFTNTK